MDWEKVLEYEADVKEIASKLGGRMNPSLIEDAIQNTYIMLRERIDLSNITKSEREYIRGAIWNNIQRFYRDERKHRYTSIQGLTQRGVQIDEKGDLKWPSVGSNYSGGFLEENE